LQGTDPVVKALQSGSKIHSLGLAACSRAKVKACLTVVASSATSPGHTLYSSRTQIPVALPPLSLWVSRASLETTSSMDSEAMNEARTNLPGLLVESSRPDHRQRGAFHSCAFPLRVVSFVCPTGGGGKGCFLALSPFPWGGRELPGDVEVSFLLAIFWSRQWGQPQRDAR
jgi:hypothetical protein